ncbi:MAG TPA: hypothetical protein P5530_03365 [Candidatus Diapherotrites archaeon]|jgi:hypothetical protein|nr:hypothetical protein [Candidatus Diapherotrites archaeon]
MLKGRYSIRRRLAPKPIRVSNTASVKKIKNFIVKRPQNKNLQVTKNKKSPIKVGDSVFIKTRYGKGLGYSKYGKQVVRENPGLLKAVYELSKSKKPFLKDPKGRFKITRLKPKAGLNTNVSYVLDLKGKKYFIKEVNDTSIDRDYSFDIKYRHGRDGVSEHKGIELLKQKGIDVIPAHVSYVDPITKKSFIVYEYTQLRTLEELYKAGDITSIKYRNIKKRVADIEKEINRNFHSYGLGEYKQIWDLDTDNVFYSMGRNRFYIFDPILLKK